MHFGIIEKVSKASFAWWWLVAAGLYVRHENAHDGVVAGPAGCQPKGGCEWENLGTTDFPIMII